MHSTDLAAAAHKFFFPVVANPLEKCKFEMKAFDFSQNIAIFLKKLTKRWIFCSNCSAWVDGCVCLCELHLKQHFLGSDFMSMSNIILMKLLVILCSGLFLFLKDIFWLFKSSGKLPSMDQSDNPHFHLHTRLNEIEVHRVKRQIFCVIWKY